RRSPRDLLEGGLWRRRGGRRAALTACSGVGQRDPGQEGVIEHDHPLDQILELANVPGERVAREALHHRWRNGKSVAPVELGVPLDEIVRQDRDFYRALAKRRDEHVDHVEAVVEILAEPT